MLINEYKLSINSETFLEYRAKQTKKKLLCFGASNYAKNIVDLFNKRGIKIDFFSDNNQQKWDTYFCGIRVISTHELDKYIDEDILITSSYVESINHMLKNKGFKNIFFLDDLLVSNNLELNLELKSIDKVTKGYSSKTLILVNDHLGDNIIRISLLERYIRYFGYNNVYFLVSSSSYDIIKLISNNLIMVDEKRLDSDKEYIKKLILEINSIGIKNLISTTHWCVKNNIKILIDNIKSENKWFNEDNDGETYTLNPQLRLFNKITKQNLQMCNIKPDIKSYVNQESILIKSINFDEKFVCFGMGASILGKMIDATVTKSLINYCLDKKFKIVLLGYGQKEVEYYNQVIKEIDNKNIINLVNKLTMVETLSVILKSNIFIGVDAGLSHAAYALNIPSIIFIGGGHFGKFMHEDSLVNYVYNNMECFVCGWKCKYCDVTNEIAPCLSNIDLKLVYKLIDKY